MKLETGADALALLADLQVAPRLFRHHELVLEAAIMLTDNLARRLGARFNAGEVQIGAALHGAPRSLLLERGVPEHLARFCVTHASWDQPTLALEDLLVALADKLWKGKRVVELEARVIQHLAHQLDQARWRVFELADAVFEGVADGADDRLRRSAIT